MDVQHWQTGQCAWGWAGHVLAWVAEVVVEAVVNCWQLLVPAALAGGVVEAKLPQESLQETAACVVV